MFGIRLYIRSVNEPKQCRNSQSYHNNLYNYTNDDVHSNAILVLNEIKFLFDCIDVFDEMVNQKRKEHRRDF